MSRNQGNSWLRSWFWVASPALIVGFLYVSGLRLTWTTDAGLLKGKTVSDQAKAVVQAGVAEIAVQTGSATSAANPPASAAAAAAASTPSAPVSAESLQFTIRRPQQRNVKGCTGCCNNGQSVVECFDVETCAESAQSGGKYALVLSQFSNPSDNFLPFLGGMREAADTAGNTDILLVIMAEDEKRLKPQNKKRLEEFNVKVMIVDWDVPPEFKFQRQGGWCGHQDFIRLHVLGLTGYDAAAYYDSDVEFQGDITPVLKCASTGKVLSTNGGMGEPLNVGFFALKPDPKLLQAARNFGKIADFDEKTGWAKLGWQPSGGYFVGAECGQGFWHTFFYKKKSPEVTNALKDAGLGETGGFEAVQIDRCIWNYQTSFQCKPSNFCKEVRAHHKPTQPRGSDPNECEKFHHEKARQEKSKPQSDQIATTAKAAAAAAASSKEKCEYNPKHPQSARPGKPCIPQVDPWPFVDKTDWKLALGERILAAATPTIDEKQCGRFELFGDSAWCMNAFESKTGKGEIALSFGIEQRDLWSEKMSNVFGMPSQLYDCYQNPEDSPPMSGKAQQGGSCKKVDTHCYEQPYTAYKQCLGPEEQIRGGREFVPLKKLISGYGPLTIHLKIDVEGSEWAPLEWLMSDDAEADKIRTFDTELHFGTTAEREVVEKLQDMDDEERLTREVEILEKLAKKYAVTGSTLEVYREGYDENSCTESQCNEPPVYISQGFSVTMFAISFVNRKLLA